MSKATILKFILQDILQRPKYTQHRIARESGVSEKTIQRILNGAALEPRYVTWKKIYNLYLKL